MRTVIDVCLLQHQDFVDLLPIYSNRDVDSLDLTDYMALSTETLEKTILDDVIIVWLNKSTVNFTKKLLLKQENHYLLCAKSIRVFVDPLSCHEYIQKTKGVNMLLIVSSSLGETFVPTIHDLPQIIYIYIFCMDSNDHEAWTKQLHKIRGVFTDDADLSKSVKNDFRSLTEVVLPFGLCNPRERSLKHLTNEQPSFMWFQLITVVLLRLPHTPEAKGEMVAECKLNYKENKAQLEKIKIFENTYKANKAITWYTENGFVFRLFNKAFRQQDSGKIFKYRFFLVDLLKQLSELHNEQYKDQQGYLTVYRGQMMFRNEFTKLKQSVGHLISINTFFSASLSSAVAASFGGFGECESEETVSVLFEFTVDLAVPGRPFARIDHLSVNKDENEVLFSIGTVFRVKSVEPELETIWYVKLEWTRDTDKELKEMKHLMGLIDFYTCQHILDHPSVLTFGWFLSQMGLLRQARHFYNYLLITLPKDDPNRGVLYNNLGEILRKLNYLERARFWFGEALEFCADTISIYHPFWAILHSNIALLNLICGKPEEALKCYRCALLVLSRCDEQNRLENSVHMGQALATIYDGMGCVFVYLNQFQNASGYHEKALKIELDLLPRDHPTLLDSYHKLGNLYVKLMKYPQALEYYEMALRIAQLNFLVKDQRYVYLHINIAKLTADISENTSKTLMHCSEALQIIEEDTLAASSSFYRYAYVKITILYLKLNLIHLALKVWEQYINVWKNQLQIHTRYTDPQKVLKDVVADQSSKSDLNYGSTFSVITDDSPSSVLSLSHVETVSLCEFADLCRRMRYINHAITCYLLLLEDQPVSDDSHFDQVHRSRLHNNLAACYQDIDDNNKALYHYQSSLDILSVGNKKKTMQTAITHYNIGLIYIEVDELNKARKHLHQSLSHFQPQTIDNTSILGVQIHIALVKVYTRWDDWYMVRNYYQRIVDRMKEDSAEPSIIERYEKYLQNAIDKISETSSLP